MAARIEVGEETMHPKRREKRGAVSLLVALSMLLAGFVSTWSPGVAAADDSERPVIWVTDQMLVEMRQRIIEREAPFDRAWAVVRSQADNALGTEYTPYQGTTFIEYYQTGRGQAQTVRNLALAFHATGDERYAAKGREVLGAWAEDANVHAADSNPSGAGLVIGRVMSIFADGYALLWETMSTAERQAVEDWMQLMVDPILVSQQIWESGELPCCKAPWLDQQYFNNHLGAQNLGLTAIGFATHDEALIDYALRSPENPRNLEVLINGVILMPADIGSGGPGDLWKGDPTVTEGAPAPEPGEIYDRYRIVEGNGLHYANLHMRLLALMAEIAYNNDAGDYFAYVGDNGENLELSFEFYSEFLVTGSADARTGYYSGETVDFSAMSMYEIAARHYDNDSIRAALESNDRVANDYETFGRTAVLTHGIDGIADDVEGEPTYWDFTSDSGAEGWTIRNSTATTTEEGLVLDMGGDPGIVSPSGLAAPASETRYLFIRMKNESARTGAQVFYSTQSNPSFSSDKVVGFPVKNDGLFHDYVVDMSGSDMWEGQINQIRLDPVSSGPGTVTVHTLALLSEKPPFPIQAPTLPAAGSVGETVTAFPGEWSSEDLEFSYRWAAGGEVLEQADGASLLITPDLAAQELTVVVTASKEGMPNVSAESGVLQVETLEVWAPETTYLAGDRVLHDGRLFVALWWTKAAVPGADPYSAWSEVGLTDECGATTSAWTDSRVYTEGDAVAHSGSVWRAAWWTRNQEPTPESSGPWALVADCG